jgi:hypothetical protein
MSYNVATEVEDGKSGVGKDNNEGKMKPLVRTNAGEDTRWQG